MTLSPRAIAIRALVERALTDPAFLDEIAVEAEAIDVVGGGTGRQLIILDYKDARYIDREVLTIARLQPKKPRRRTRVKLAA